MADPRPCYCQRGDAPMVAVPAEGTWLVRDGKATEAEADLTGVTPDDSGSGASGPTP